jgi:hypothetical protein
MSVVWPRNAVFIVLNSWPYVISKTQLLRPMILTNLLYDWFYHGKCRILLQRPLLILIDLSENTVVVLSYIFGRQSWALQAYLGYTLSSLPYIYRRP